MAKISIEGMEFFAYHGCFQEEQIIGTRFLVDVHMLTDTHEAEQTDNLKATVNYQAVYLAIKDEMAIKSKLLEHVSRRILDRLFRDFPAVESIDIKISKMNPPVGGKVESVSVSLAEKKTDE